MDVKVPGLRVQMAAMAIRTRGVIIVVTGVVVPAITISRPVVGVAADLRAGTVSAIAIRGRCVCTARVSVAVAAVTMPPLGFGIRGE